MKTIVAEHAGFVFGVKRAVDIVEETLKNSNNKIIYSLGPLIHNTQAVENLKGIKTNR